MPKLSMELGLTLKPLRFDNGEFVPFQLIILKLQTHVETLIKNFFSRVNPSVALKIDIFSL